MPGSMQRASLRSPGLHSLVGKVTFKNSLQQERGLRQRAGPALLSRSEGPSPGRGVAISAQFPSYQQQFSLDWIKKNNVSEEHSFIR